MHECNAGQPNLKEPVPRVSLLYRSAPVNYAKRGTFWYKFCKLFRGTVLNFFKLPKKCSSDGLLLRNTPYFASNHEMSLSKKKNIFQNPVFRG